jgi:endonuclease-3
VSGRARAAGAWPGPRLLALIQALEAVYGRPSLDEHPRLKPLEELILTILSQNTNDTNRDRAYADLRARFSTWDDVADAPLPAIARAIRRGGLGPTKSVRLREILRSLRDRGIPLDARAFARMRSSSLWELLVGLKGVGPKTAACVLLFSLGRPFFPVDTHVHRVARRLGLVPDTADPVSAQELLQAVIAPGDVYDLHMLLIRHGREVCIASRPFCSRCPIATLCPRVGVVGAR